jgi:hypothetical protein
MLTIACSLLVLTHIPSTIIGGISLGIYAICAIDRSKLVPTFKHLAVVGLSTLGATAFHWIKLVTETAWVQHDLPNYYATGYYDHSRYFFPMYLVAPVERYVQRLLWHLDVVIVLTALFAVPALWLLAKRIRGSGTEQATNTRLLPLTAVFIASAWMLSMASSFVWKAAPFLAKLQFPWRWLLVTTAIGPILFCAAASRISEGRARPGRPLVYLTTIFVLSLSLFSLTQNALLSSEMSEEKFVEQVNGMNEAEGCPCWWPVWARAEAFNTSQRAVAGPKSVSVEKWDDEERVINLGGGEHDQVRIATFYHPYWTAAVGGKAVDIAADADGVIVVTVPPQSSEVLLTFREPTYLTIAKVLSGMAWIALLGILLLDVYRKRTEWNMS